MNFTHEQKKSCRQQDTPPIDDVRTCGQWKCDRDSGIGIISSHLYHLYRTDNGLVINLYHPCSAWWRREIKIEVIIIIIKSSSSKPHGIRWTTTIVVGKKNKKKKNTSQIMPSHHFHTQHVCFVLRVLSLSLFLCAYFSLDSAACSLMPILGCVHNVLAYRRTCCVVAFDAALWLWRFVYTRFLLFLFRSNRWQRNEKKKNEVKKTEQVDNNIAFQVQRIEANVSECGFIIGSIHNSSRLTLHGASLVLPTHQCSQTSLNPFHLFRGHIGWTMYTNPFT